MNLAKTNTIAKLITQIRVKNVISQFEVCQMIAKAMSDLCIDLADIFFEIQRMDMSNLDSEDREELLSLIKKGQKQFEEFQENAIKLSDRIWIDFHNVFDNEFLDKLFYGGKSFDKELFNQLKRDCKRLFNEHYSTFDDLSNCLSTGVTQPKFIAYLYSLLERNNKEISKSFNNVDLSAITSVVNQLSGYANFLRESFEMLDTYIKHLDLTEV